jgi:serine/threonine protein kinase
VQEAPSVSHVGQTIGNYKVVQQIGEGGMGVVYMAEHPVIGRKVAIKLLHASFAHDPDTVARFFNEARAIHIIRQRNIVEILDFGQTTDGQPYFIMEFLVGESLADRIARGPVPPAEAVGIATQICDALQAAHDKNIVHRDLKPHNVFLVGTLATPDVKILDFGVAKMTTGWGDASQSGGQSVKTRTGSLMGTPLYMSPEQCRGSGKLDHRTDIYSLAVILYEMISGQPPFTAEGVGELFAKHMFEPAPSLAILAPETPPHIVAAVARGLSKNLEDRFVDMMAMRAALTARVEAAQPAQPAKPVTSDAVGGLASGAVAAPARAARQSTVTSVRGPSTISGIQSTTLSSSVSELDDSLVDSIETLGQSGRRRKGLVLGLFGAAAVLVLGVVALRRSTPPLAPSEAASKAVVESMAPRATEAPPPPAVAAPATVRLRFEAEPNLTHVFRVSDNPEQPEDLGPVPLDITVPRTSQPSEFILRAEGHTERVVRVEASHDRSLHFTLDRLPVAEKKPKPPERKPAPPRAQRRPALHDADGLAVPSF